jgi:putative oxidoreductase
MTKSQKISYFILLTLTSVLFLFTGYSKLAAVPQVVQGFQAAHLPIWFMYVVGTCEILGAIGLWFGVASNETSRKLSLWAVYGLYIILAGAVITSMMFVSVSSAVFPLLVGVILSIIVWLGNKRTALKNIPKEAAQQA